MTVVGNKHGNRRRRFIWLWLAYHGHEFSMKLNFYVVTRIAGEPCGAQRRDEVVNSKG